MFPLKSVIYVNDQFCTVQSHQDLNVITHGCFSAFAYKSVTSDLGMGHVVKYAVDSCTAGHCV